RKERDTSSQSLQSPAKDLGFICYLALVFLSAIVFFQIFTTYPLYLHTHYQLNEFQIGLVFAINTVMIVVFEMLLVQRAKNWNLLTVIGWGNFLACLGLGILPFNDAIWFCVLSMLVLTLGEMLASPMSTSWVSKRSKQGDTGRYMGWYTMAYSLAFILGPALGGLVYDYQPEFVWYGALGIAMVVWVGFYFLNVRISKPKNVAS
ncbi:MAG: MFS transporter, partial [Planctomycetota bacterium]